MDDNTSDCATADVHDMLADLRLAIEKHLPEVDGGHGSYWVNRVERAGALITRADVTLRAVLGIEEPGTLDEAIAEVAARIQSYEWRIAELKKRVDRADYDAEGRNVSITAECGRLTRELADASTKIAGMTVTLQSSRASRDAYIAELRGEIAARPSLSVALEGTAAGAIARKRMRNTLAAWDKAWAKKPVAKPKPTKPTATLVVGDHVVWTSSAAGTTKTKRGKVLEVVPAGKLPATCDARGARYWGRRNHVWFVVAVDGELYYPRAAALRRARGAK